jgi:hypothetical protein
MNPRPIAVEPIENYRLIVTFQNGETKIFDVSTLLQYPMYENLKDKSVFNLVKVDGHCIYWDDDIDICPDMLYEKSVKHD